MNCSIQPIALTQLPYSYQELEPFMSAQIVEIHHQKHHQGYVTNFNKLLQDFLTAMGQNETHKAQAILPKLHFNLGGHNCHDLYWKNLAPKSQQGGVLPLPTSKLAQAISQTWGSIDNFITSFNQKAAVVQGSGWAWLAINTQTKNLSILTTQTHDSVEAIDHDPLLVVDVWEHAYYLQYQNLRADFLKQIWEIINWKEVETRYSKYQ